MQKDMKIGMLAGLVLAVGVMLYVCTRQSLSPRARILSREHLTTENNQQVLGEDEQDVQLLKPIVVFKTARAEVEPVKPARKEIVEVSQQEQLKSPDNQVKPKVVVEQEPIIKHEPVEEPPQDRYKTRKFYIVRRGDTLSRISKKYYNTANNWYVIYEANRDVLSNPNMLQPRTKLFIPD